MRFTAANFVLGLATLGNLRPTFGRVLYGYDTGEHPVEQANNDTLVARMPPPVLKPAPKPIPAPNHDPVAPVEPLTPGGDKTPGNPGTDQKPEGDPEPLAPGDKQPETPTDKKPEGEPAPLTPGDKQPETPTDKTPNADEKLTVGIEDRDLWCDFASAAGKAAKRSVEKRTGGNPGAAAGGGRSCGVRSERESSHENPAVRNPILDARGNRAENELIALNAQGKRQLIDPTDYVPRLQANYDMKIRTMAELKVGPITEQIGNPRFANSGPMNWRTVDTYANGYTEGPVTSISIGRSEGFNAQGRPIDDDHLMVIAHDRFAARDSNRYPMDPKGNPLEQNGQYVLKDNWRQNSIPVSNLVHLTMQGTRQFDKMPKKIIFTSDKLRNDDVRFAIGDVFASGLPRTSQGSIILRRGVGGPEGQLYTRLSGTDNNYSYMNTVGRNDDFKDYDPESIEVWEDKELMTLTMNKVR